MKPGSGMMHFISDRWKKLILTICCASFLAGMLPTDLACAEADQAEAWTLDNVIPSNAMLPENPLETNEGKREKNGDEPNSQNGETGSENEQYYDDAEREWIENGYDDTGDDWYDYWDDETEPGVAEADRSTESEYYLDTDTDIATGSAYAYENEDVIITESVGAQQAAAEDDGTSTPEELLNAYAEMVMNGAAPLPGRPKLRNDALITGNRLEGIEKAIYNELKAQIAQVAAGAVTSSVFSIPVENLGLAKTEWTKEDLGLETLVEINSEGKYQYTREAKEMVAMNMYFDLTRILSALLADCPYELYWFDKTEGIIGGS